MTDIPMTNVNEDTPTSDEEITQILATETDPGAPFGRKLDGTPRLSNGGRPPTAKRKQPSGAQRRKAAAAKAPGVSPPAAKKSAPPRPTKRDYRQGIEGLFQTVALPLAFVPVTGARDAYTIATYAPGVAEALNDLAGQQPAVAAALDKLMAVGPYGALIGALVPMAVQLAHNHNAIPVDVAVKLGATPVEVLDAHLAEAAASMQTAPQNGAAREPVAA